jgi:hypothetical protein
VLTTSLRRVCKSKRVQTNSFQTNLPFVQVLHEFEEADLQIGPGLYEVMTGLNKIVYGLRKLVEAGPQFINALYNL